MLKIFKIIVLISILGICLIFLITEIGPTPIEYEFIDLNGNKGIASICANYSNTLRCTDKEGCYRIVQSYKVVKWK